jgi:hypothetical protein
MIATIAAMVIEGQKRESIAIRSRRSLHADNRCAVIIRACNAELASSTPTRDGVEGAVFAGRTTSPFVDVEAVRTRAEICCTREAPAREKAPRALLDVRA